MNPTSAILAVTLNCNARCTMCDIWQNNMTNELKPEEYALLPASLRDINISGGEPFLRKDLPEIISVLKDRCPAARFVISTNGFLPQRIDKLVTRILQDIPSLAVRVSIDGLHETHDEIRGIDQGFSKCLQTLEGLRALGVSDLGIGFTILKRNLHELPQVYEFAEQHHLQLSVTLATDSSIFFGTDKQAMRPEADAKLDHILRGLSRREYKKMTPKHWFRGWFADSLRQYAFDGQRPLTCDAGSGFFYLDSLGNVFGCHLLPNKMGNLRENTWDAIWTSADGVKARDEAKGCHDCWMVCTSKSAIRRNLPVLAVQAALGKARSHLARDPWV